MFESRKLQRVFSGISEHYRLTPAEVDPAIRAVWYPTQGCASAKMSAEDTEEFVRNLHGYKQANLAVVERCATELSQSGGLKQRLQLKLEEATALLTVINDHRLLCAAEHQIRQEEMDLRSLKEISRLPAPQQAALYDIHLLAYLMEELLRVLH